MFALHATAELDSEDREVGVAVAGGKFNAFRDTMQFDPVGKLYRIRMVDRPSSSIGFIRITNYAEERRLGKVFPILGSKFLV
jgi:hypothetical protein